MARKRFDDEDDDDRPRRSRRRDDDDEDFDERPRRRRSKPKSGLPTWAWVAIPLGLVLLLCCGFVSLPLLLPAVSKVRSAASKAKQTNNIKQIGLALHGLHDVNGGFTAPFALDDNKQPNPGLSWRVGVLPFIEQNAVYAQFDRSKSWDSPRNQPFSNQKISTYTSPDELNAAGANTVMFGFNGPGALMEANVKPPLTFARIPDGSANTAMVAEVTIGAPWASPTDVPYTRNGPLPSFGAAGNDSFLLLMADGSVRNVKKNIPPAIMHALIQIDDGQVINLDGF